MAASHDEATQQMHWAVRWQRDTGYRKTLNHFYLKSQSCEQLKYLTLTQLTVLHCIFDSLIKPPTCEACYCSKEGGLYSSGVLPKLLFTVNCSTSKLQLSEVLNYLTDWNHDSVVLLLSTFCFSLSSSLKDTCNFLTRKSWTFFGDPSIP